MNVNSEEFEKMTKRPARKYTFPVLVVCKNKSNIDGASKKRVMIDFAKFKSVNVSSIQTENFIDDIVCEKS